MSAAATTELTALPRSPSLPTFFDNLDSFAEAPEGVAKLRELILDLAVRGKLVEQDENDEPASELVKRIIKEGTRLANGKGVSRSKQIPPIQREDVEFDLPRNWAAVRLKDISARVSVGHVGPTSQFYCEKSEDGLESGRFVPVALS